MTRIAITGGAGYIGSHTAKHLASAGAQTLVYDNLSRGHRELVRWGSFVEGDLAETTKLASALQDFGAEAVIHFAALAYVGESVTDPGRYYANNVGGTVSLLEAMRIAGCRNLVVSSSCATYGEPDAMPIVESTPQRPINPYGWSKLMMEQACADFEVAHGIRTVALRYFNAAGCDPEGETGELHDPETHLIPRALMAVTGEIPALEVFGDDYPTPDGTCVRDYIHVDDLADAHVRAVDYLIAGGASEAFNLGTGAGNSVKQILDAIARVTGQPVPHIIRPRRPGDPPELVANADKANRTLGWEPRSSSIETIVETAWNWHKRRHD